MIGNKDLRIVAAINTCYRKYSGLTLPRVCLVVVLAKKEIGYSLSSPMHVTKISFTHILSSFITNNFI